MGEKKVGRIASSSGRRLREDREVGLHCHTTILSGFLPSSLNPYLHPSFDPSLRSSLAVFQDSTRNADLPYDFFMSRYKDAYLQETKVRGREGEGRLVK